MNFKLLLLGTLLACITVAEAKGGYDNMQPFVIDPVDLTKTWINSHDDMYEDATGKLWNII
jgi:hypothetical protein